MLNNVFLVTCVLFIVVSLFYAHADQRRQIGDYVQQSKAVLNRAAEHALLSTSASKNKEWFTAYISITKAIALIETLVQGRSVPQVSYDTKYDVAQMLETYQELQQHIEQQMRSDKNYGLCFSSHYEHLPTFTTPPPVPDTLSD